MNYPFVCKCGYSEIISMPINEYRSNNHFCPICGEEMTREVKSLVCMGSVDLTNSFYRRNN